MITLPVIFSAGLLFVPESPTWLVMKDRLPQAARSIGGIYPQHSEEEVEFELARQCYTVEKEMEDRIEVSRACLPPCIVLDPSSQFPLHDGLQLTLVTEQERTLDRMILGARPPTSFRCGIAIVCIPAGRLDRLCSNCLFVLRPCLPMSVLL